LKVVLGRILRVVDTGPPAHFDYEQKSMSDLLLRHSGGIWLQGASTQKKSSARDRQMISAAPAELRRVSSAPGCVCYDKLGKANG
jgi:hypothetical protein